MNEDSEEKSHPKDTISFTFNNCGISIYESQTEFHLCDLLSKRYPRKYSYINWVRALINNLVCISWCSQKLFEALENVNFRTIMYNQDYFSSIERFLGIYPRCAQKTSCVISENQNVERLAFFSSDANNTSYSVQVPNFSWFDYSSRGPNFGYTAYQRK